MDNFKIGLGPVFDFDAPASSNDIDTDPVEKEAGNEEQQQAFLEISLTNALFIGGVALLTILIGAYICYCRRGRSASLPTDS